MPQIPLYRSQVGGPRAPAAAAPLSGRDPLAGALDAAGDALRGIARTDAVLAARKADEAAALDAGRVLQDGKLRWQREIDARARAQDLTDGSFTPQLLADYDAFVAEQVNGAADTRVQRFLTAGFARHRETIGETALGLEAGARTMANRTAAAKTTDSARALVRSDSAAFDATLAELTASLSALDLPQVERQALLQQAASGLAQSAVEGEVERDPRAALQRLSGGAWDAFIDPDAKDALIGRGQSELRRREAEQRARQAAAQAALTERLRDYQAGLQAGVPADPAQLAQAISAARSLGRPELARALQTLGVRNATAQIAQALTPQEIQSELNALNGRIAQAGAAAPAILLTQRDQLEASLSAAKSGLKVDPISYAARAGVVAVSPLDFADAASVAARRQSARAVAAHYGLPRARYLTDEEAAALGNLVREGAPADRLDLAQSLVTGFGRDAPAVFAEIGADDPVFARAGALLAKGPAHAATAQRMLAGQAQLAAKQVKPPSQAEALVAMTDVMGAALASQPQRRAEALASATALYAADLAASGGDASTFDPPRFEAALRTALGARTGADGTVRGGPHVPGSAGWRGVGRPNRPAILLPDDMSAVDFDAAWFNLTDVAARRAGLGGPPVDAQGAPVPASLLRQGVLEDAGDGLYRVRLGASYVRGGGPGGFYVLDARALEAGQ